MNLPNYGTSTSVVINSSIGNKNADWEIENLSDIPDWLTLNKDGDTLTITTTNNY